MTRYTFDPRHDARLRRTFSVGIQDEQRPSWNRIVARVSGPSEHAHAIRAAARTYCDYLNALQGFTSDSHATVVLCEGGEARVVVRGRVVARCDAFDADLNEAWAGLVAASLNDCINALPVGDEVARV